VKVGREVELRIGGVLAVSKRVIKELIGVIEGEE
jgi:hypothetical protein